MSNRILFIIFLSIITALLLSAIRAGFYYEFNSDELYHAQFVYQIVNRTSPFLDFYSFYTPLFHLLLLPFFSFIGFNFKALYMARVIMITLFIARILISIKLINLIFDKRSALIFLALYLLQPFTASRVMDVRPENFMFFTYTLGLFLFLKGFIKSSDKALFISGILFALSSLIHSLVIPSLISLYFILLIYTWKEKKIQSFWISFLGFSLPVFLFFSFYLLQGQLGTVLNQLYIYPFKSIALADITPFGIFYLPFQPSIYAESGKPLIWIYSWLLLFFAGAGLSSTVHSLIYKKGIFTYNLNVIKIFFTLSLFIQWIPLFFMRAAFPQYYLLFNWSLAIFAAVFFSDLITFVKKIKDNRLIGYFYSILIFLLVLFSISNIKANNIRSEIRSDSFFETIKLLWSEIPENAKTFPNILFRPLAYPILIGGGWRDLGRLTPLVETLEENKVQYILMRNLYEFSPTDPKFIDYVTANFKIVDKKLNLWKRIK